MNRYSILSFFAALFLLACHSSFGQDVKVRGTIVDSLSGNPEISAIVQFYRSEDSTKPIAYTTTDADGVFTHSLPGKGEYRLFLHNLGKKDRSILFTIGDDIEIDLGTIAVQDDTETLQAGSVTALSKLVSIDSDKITYRVESDIEAKTKSVLDILRKIPLVSVNAQGAISVNGSSSFIVTVDGMKNQIMSNNPSEVFAAMPANMVQSIEVITEPGARYDAEGVEAVLSLTSVTKGKDAEDGFYNANVNLGGSLRRVNGGLFFAAVQDKWTVSVDLSSISIWSGDNSLYRERLSNAGSGQMSTFSSGVSNTYTSTIIGGLSASYEINKYNLLSLSAGGIDLYNKDKEFLKSSINAQSQAYEYEEHTSSSMRFDRLNANIDYQHLWKDGSQKTFVLSYQISSNPSWDKSEDKYLPLSSLPSSLVDRKNDRRTNSLTHSIQSDLILPISKQHSFITGAKLMFRHNMSEANVQSMTDAGYVYDESQSVNYDFYNNIGALYAEYSGRVKAFRLRAGVRYEHTWQEAQYEELPDKDFGLDYGNLVPNGSIQFDINGSQNMGLSYSMSIRRPGITYLNPYVDLSDPSAMTYGNPDLKAETGHQLGLSYNLMSDKWLVTMRLRQGFRNNGISRYMFYDENNILNTTYGNIVKSSSTSLNAYLSWSPAQKTTIILSGYAGYNIFKSSELDLSADGWTCDFSAMLQQVLPGDIVLNANVLYLPNSLSIQSYTNGIWSSELSLSRSFLKDKLNVSLRGMTHLTKRYGALMGTIYSGNDFTAKDEIIMPWRDVFINLSYTFGSSDYIQVKKSRKKSSSNDQVDLDKTAKSF